MTIVLGYVQTPEGAAALAAALEVLHEGESLIVINKAEESIFSAEQDADALRERLQRHGVAAQVRELYETEDPAETIVSEAIDSGARLVVIGLRKRSPMGKMLLGSTAQSVLFDAPCPVLTVKAGSAA